MRAPLRIVTEFEPPSVPRETVGFSGSFSRKMEGVRSAGDPPHVMVVATSRLPSTARLAMELHDAGARVSLIAPANNPAMVLDFLDSKASHGAVSPWRLLQARLLQRRPDTIVPCDERTVRDLHELFRRTTHDEIKHLVERSIGSSTGFATVRSRHRLLSLAKQLGVRAPESRPLQNVAALDDWMSQNPAPFVLKSDGSWAGLGVRIVSDARTARDRFWSMGRPTSAYLALRELLLEGDRFVLRSWLQSERPALSVQSYIDGLPANIGVACWHGEVLASICAESVSTQSATGPSTVARIIENPEMVEAATRIVQALGLSGLIGFDFMIEAATGYAFLIEMNARNTPICSVRLGPGRDLLEAFVAHLAQRPVRARPTRTDRDIIAFFPDTWQTDPSSQYLHIGYHDVPWEQPELVRRLMKPELRDRYWVLRKLSQARRRIRDRWSLHA